MKNIIYIIISCILFFGNSETLWGQINIGGEPYSFMNYLPSYSNTKAAMMPSVNMAKARAERADNEFGVTHEVFLSLEDDGVWTELPNGDRVWRLNIHAAKATSINLVYSDFWLPKGATLYLYAPNYTQVLGGFTAVNNKGLRDDWTRFATGLVLGEYITLEYYEPLAVKGQGQIEIEQVIQGHTDPYSGAEKSYRDAMPCQNNVNCAEGNNWQNEKTGVAYIVMGGFICSGALLNSHIKEAIPYFLTADHCSDLDAKGDADASHWVFYWNYETSSCSNTVGNPIFNAQSTTGAVLVANNDDTDFALFRLLENPAFTGAWMLGWDTKSDRPTSGAGIHHPAGDAKKISIQNDPSSSFGGSINWIDSPSTPAHTHWEVKFDNGGTEGGSSGSPFFDQNHRIVGQLHGGTGLCPGDSGFRKFYGKLSVSWNGRGSSDQHRRLQNWLSPTCKNERNVSGIARGEQPVIKANKLNSTAIIRSRAFTRYEAEVVTLKPGFQASAGSDFRATAGASCGSNSQGDDRAKSGDAVTTIDARSSKGEVRTYTNLEEIEARTSEPAKENLNSGDFTLFPNPSAGESNLRFRLQHASIVTISVFNAQGKLMKEITENYSDGTHEVLLNTSHTWSAGMYFVRLETNSATTSKSLVLNQ